MASAKMVYKEDKDKNTIEFVFSSSMNYIDDACEKITRYLTHTVAEIDQELFSINLVIREGLTNAIRHGNRSNKSKEVRFLMALRKGPTIYIEIEDQGKGFDWRRYTKELPPQERDHGRGIPIMAAYFDRYFYNDKGNILYLEKTLFS